MPSRPRGGARRRAGPVLAARAPCGTRTAPRWTRRPVPKRPRRRAAGQEHDRLIAGLGASRMAVLPSRGRCFVCRDMDAAGPRRRPGARAAPAPRGEDDRHPGLGLRRRPARRGTTGSWLPQLCSATQLLDKTIERLTQLSRLTPRARRFHPWLERTAPGASAYNLCTFTVPGGGGDAQRAQDALVDVGLDDVERRRRR